MKQKKQRLVNFHWDPRSTCPRGAKEGKGVVKKKKKRKEYEVSVSRIKGRNQDKFNSNIIICLGMGCQLK